MAPDMDVIRKLVTSDVARIILTALGERQKDYALIDLQRVRRQLLKSGANFDEAEFYQVFRSFEQGGLGMIIYNKSGVPSQFKWRESMKNVSRLATESVKMNANAVTPFTPSKGFTAQRPQTVTKRGGNSISHSAKQILDDDSISDAKKVQMLKVYFEDL